jgi:antitoxin component YwqK of YwqJK toxin-antitoxin module
MKKILIVLTYVSMLLFSCKQAKKEPETVNKNPRTSAYTKKDSVKKEPAIKDIVYDNGENVLFYPDGRIKIRGKKKDGKREGHWESWYPDGTRWSECDYKAGIKDGRSVTYFSNGKKRFEGFYKNDVESGIWKFYLENGQLVKTVDYSKVK